MATPHPFNTEKPITPRGKLTYQAIDMRLKELSPKIDIKDFIGPTNLLLAVPTSSLDARDGTLDGIYFRTDKVAELKQALYNATDKDGKRAFASMKEEPKNCALKLSFGVTEGTGWREIWRPKKPKPEALKKGNVKPDSALSMRFGTAGVPFDFTALHCSVDEKTGKCNIHIDEAGFMLDLPGGFAMTPNVYQHVMDELLLKTILRDWLSETISDQKLGRVVVEVLRRVSVKFPNSFNGYAGVTKTMNSFKKPTSVTGALKGIALGTVNIIKPVGLSVEAYRSEDLLLQVNYMKVDNHTTFTVTLGGTF